MVTPIDGRPGSRKAKKTQKDEHDEQEIDVRFTFANERTFLAWNRTAIALIAGGLAMAQLLDFRFDSARLVVSLPVIGLGASLALGSYGHWKACERAMRRGQPLPVSHLPRLLAIGVSAVALTVAVAAIIEGAA